MTKKTGLYTIVEAVIMISPNNEIWAAVIDVEDEKAKHSTNTSDVDKLPEAIEDWRERFSEMEVIYVNK